MAVVNTQAVSPAGTTPTYNAASGGGDKITNPQGTVVIVRNAGGAPITVTVAAQATLPNGGTYPSLVVSVPATTGERWLLLGPEYTDSNGQANLAWSGVTSVTFACINNP